MNANMRAIIVEVSFRTVVAVPDEAAETDDLELLATEITRDNMADVMLAAERAPGLQIRVVKQAETADEVLNVFDLSGNDDPVLFTCGGHDEPSLSEIFPEEVE